MLEELPFEPGARCAVTPPPLNLFRFSGGRLSVELLVDVFVDRRLLGMLRPLDKSLLDFLFVAQLLKLNFSPTARRKLLRFALMAAAKNSWHHNGRNCTTHTTETKNTKFNPQGDDFANIWVDNPEICSSLKTAAVMIIRMMR